jgi:Rps23 Pro-64 3,4-dihydroxylase Tpa1-like proline 4-hydroxylase
MTPKQILDSFSETLMQDERILSAPERALLTSLLQHAKTSANDNPDTGEAVRKVIASAVGETVAQRAFAVLGGSIVEKIVEGSAAALSELPETSAGKKSHKPGKTPLRTPGVPGTPGQPQPPQTILPPSPPGPQPPQTKLPPPPGPQPPQTTPRKAPPRDPQPPSHGPQTPGHAPLRDTPIKPTQPQPPQSSIERVATAENTVAVQERPAQLPARCLVLHEFLAPQEVEQLTSFTLGREKDFRASEVISPVAEGGVVNYEHRRSRVLMEIEPYQSLIVERIKGVLPQVLEKLGMEEFDIAGVEAQITASGDGDFFRFHSDNGSDRVESRYLTFVYFFHREPRQFEGGELRIHDARLDGEDYVSENTYQVIAPQQNQIVFFPCEMMHEITPVKSDSGLFADSRFTLNGWLRR